MKRTNVLYGYLIIGFLLCIYGIVGQMDYRDALAERDYYCRMVRAKAWPDYRHIAKSECSHGP